MEIRPIGQDRLEEVFAILRSCKEAMDAEGIYQWVDSYPNREAIAQDMDMGCIYGLMDGDACAGVVSINAVQDEKYKTIAWQYNDGIALVIHRLAVHPLQQGNGYARRLMDFAEALAIESGAASIRLDAYSGNKRALKFYEQRGYIKRGEVYFPLRDLPFFCYEKAIITPSHF